MGLFSILFKSNANDQFNPLTFEKDLDEIHKKIESTEKRLVSFKRKSKHFQQQVTIWLTAGCFVYIGYVYKTGKYQFYENPDDKYYVVGGFVAIVAIYLIHQLIGIYNDKILKYYLRKITFYKKQRQQKITDLKVKTNFNKTKRLLQKYSIQDFHNMDPSSDNNADGNQTSSVNSPDMKNTNNIRNTSQTPAITVSSGEADAATIDENAYNTDGDYGDDDYAHQLDSIEQRYSELDRVREKRLMIKRGTYDPDSSSSWLSPVSSVFEMLVGKDELSPSSRYALICINCFTHNGLAPPRYLPNQVKFICCNCGTVNNPNAGNLSAVSTPKLNDFDSKSKDEGSSN
ncbi:hypothetical protein DASC09_060370 [Saccharomycopsis crataegensis]|uniref:Endoplasmic reticulum junction formation protein lunapark n=1 Tax=Saccharomycopsis crataegensis TaxID=43959 RepID=A0AAV5QX75_9ASCO|nr:hypothetical protein DASC09_060370 [Saccharomycopsis crataegensis]